MQTFSTVALDMFIIHANALKTSCHEERQVVPHFQDDDSIVYY